MLKKIFFSWLMAMLVAPSVSAAVSVPVVPKVCGIDGVTYSTATDAQAAGTTVSYNKACVSPSSQSGLRETKTPVNVIGVVVELGDYNADNAYYYYGTGQSMYLIRDAAGAEYSVKVTRSSKIYPNITKIYPGDQVRLVGTRNENTGIIDASSITRTSVNSSEKSLQGVIRSIQPSDNGDQRITIAYNYKKKGYTHSFLYNANTLNLNYAGGSLAVGDTIRYRYFVGISSSVYAHSILLLKKGAENVYRSSLVVAAATVTAIGNIAGNAGQISAKYINGTLAGSGGVKASEYRNGMEFGISYAPNTKFVMSHYGLTDAAHLNIGDRIFVVGRTTAERTASGTPIISARLIKNESLWKSELSNYAGVVGSIDYARKVIAFDSAPLKDFSAGVVPTAKSYLVDIKSAKLLKESGARILISDIKRGDKVLLRARKVSDSSLFGESLAVVKEIPALNIPSTPQENPASGTQGGSNTNPDPSGNTTTDSSSQTNPLGVSNPTDDRVVIIPLYDQGTNIKKFRAFVYSKSLPGYDFSWNLDNVFVKGGSGDIDNVYEFDINTLSVGRHVLSVQARNASMGMKSASITIEKTVPGIVGGSIKYDPAGVNLTCLEYEIGSNVACHMLISGSNEAYVPSLTSHRWSLGSAQITSSHNGFSLGYNNNSGLSINPEGIETGLYPVTLTANNSNGTQVSSSIFIGKRPELKTIVTPLATDSQYQGFKAFTAGAKYPIYYSWSINDTKMPSTATSSNPGALTRIDISQYPIGHNYVVVRAYDSSGAVGEAHLSFYRYASSLKAVFSSSAVELTCVEWGGEDSSDSCLHVRTAVSANMRAPLSYAWTVNGVAITTEAEIVPANHPSLIPLGINDLKLTVTDSVGYKQEATIPFGRNAYPNSGVTY